MIPHISLICATGRGFSPIKAIMNTLDGNNKWLTDMIDDAAVRFESLLNHPLNDVTLCFDTLHTYVGPILTLVSVEGFYGTGTNGYNRLRDLPLEGDIEVMKEVFAIVNAKNNSSSYETPVCLVHVLSQPQLVSEVNKFKEYASKLNLGRQVSVAVVHDMSAFLPSLAHRLSIETAVNLSDYATGRGEGL